MEGFLTYSYQKEFLATGKEDQSGERKKIDWRPINIMLNDEQNARTKNYKKKLLKHINWTN